MLAVPPGSGVLRHHFYGSIRKDGFISRPGLVGSFIVMGKAIVVRKAPPAPRQIKQKLLNKAPLRLGGKLYLPIMIYERLPSRVVGLSISEVALLPSPDCRVRLGFPDLLEEGGSPAVLTVNPLSGSC